MGREICCLNGHYFEYCITTEKISSPVLPRLRFENWYLDRYTSAGASSNRLNQEMRIRLRRVDQTGTSSTISKSLADAVANNTEGADGVPLSWDDFCALINARSDAPAEAREVKYLKPAADFQTRLDDMLVYWIKHLRANAAVPLESSRAIDSLAALQFVRVELFGSELSQDSVPI